MCYKLPFTSSTSDLQSLVYLYLENKGIKEKRFKENKPGLSWCHYFMQRNPELAECLCENIKRVCAAVTKNVLQEYFDNLRISLQDVQLLIMMRQI